MLVVTNLPFLVAAMIAFQKRFYVWCMMLLMVFVASTAYHSCNHPFVMALFDRVCASVVVVVITCVAMLQCSQTFLSLGFVTAIVGLTLFWHDEVDGYQDHNLCFTHSLWHICASVTCILFLVSMPPS